MLIILALGSTIHYANKYINKRDFMDLRNVSMDKTIDSKKLSSKLSGLKWVSCLQPNNPEKEIAQLKTKLTGAEHTANFNQEQIDSLLTRLNSGVNIEEFTEQEQEFLQNYLSRQDVLGG